jgi:hypothetical protein
MKDANGPNVMNVNKRNSAIAALFLGVVLSAPGVFANPQAGSKESLDGSGTLLFKDPRGDDLEIKKNVEGLKPVDPRSGLSEVYRAAEIQPDYVAPPLHGVKEVATEYPVFTDATAANECNLSREALLTVVQRNLQDPLVNLVVLDRRRSRDLGSVNMIYEVHTARVDQFCLSWLNVKFTDTASIILPPLKVARTLAIDFWHKATLARSPLDRHQQAVGDALATLSRQFLRDLKLAEPAAYNTGFMKRQLSEDEERELRNQQMMRSLSDAVSRNLIDSKAGAADIPTTGSKNPVTPASTP